MSSAKGFCIVAGGSWGAVVAAGAALTSLGIAISAVRGRPSP